MKFGALPERLLSSASLSLPPEPQWNERVLPGKRGAQPKVYVGAATWGDASWAGRLYLPKTPATRFRQFYPQHFNTIELNATHYNIYAPAVISNWAAAARGKDFKFCPKFPQQISHHSGFVGVEDVTAAFLESIRAFEQNLGPSFLQVSESFSPAHKEALFHYLATLPRDLRFFLELRHPAWFRQKEIEEWCAALHELKMGAVITDAPGRRDVAHMHLTVPRLFLRFVCNAVHPTSFSRADDWIARIQYWMQKGLEEIYIFLHPGNDAAVPELATYWINEINAKCGVHLSPPVAAQPGLF